MIAERISKSRDLHGRDAEANGEHGGEAQQRPGGAQKMSAQFAGPGETFQRCAAKLAGVALHRLTGKIARERRQGGVLGLILQLQQVDELRTK